MRKVINSTLMIWVALATIVAGQRPAAIVQAEIRQAESDVPKLAAVLELKPGMNVADVGAGFGAMTIVMSKWVGPAGRVFATDIAPAQITALREVTAREHLENVTVVEGAERSTSLPDACCDAIFMRDVYHHLTQPAELIRSLFTALRTGGRLAIIDFEPRPGSTLPDGVAANRGGHGIRPPIVVTELNASGLTHVTTISEWPPDTNPAAYFLVLFRKP